MLMALVVYFVQLKGLTVKSLMQLVDTKAGWHQERLDASVCRGVRL